MNSNNFGIVSLAVSGVALTAVIIPILKDNVPSFIDSAMTYLLDVTEEHSPIMVKKIDYFLISKGYCSKKSFDHQQPLDGHHAYFFEHTLVLFTRKTVNDVHGEKIHYTIRCWNCGRNF
jgi:hypothetical protein